MKKWTKKELCRKLKSPDELTEMHEQISGSVYRQTFHIQPVTGLLNDPNGFIYKDGVWHLFYQWCPWGAVHGLKHWYHTTSENLINWKNLGVSIYPDTYFDNKGVYTGSAMQLGDEIYLYYTGNHRDDDWTRRSFTCMAKLTDGKLAKKYSAPLFGPCDEYTENQRDPKIVYDEETNKYYIIMGAQTKDNRGCAIIYSSSDPKFGWEYRGKLNVPGFEDFGGMWECPSLEHLGDHDILIFCPQHLTLEGHGTGTNHCGYIIGYMDYENLTFTPDGSFHVLDFGFDFYAAACCANVNEKNKAILTAWMGLPDASYPTDSENWSGCLTLPRELSIRHRRLIQRPIKGLESMRENQISPGLGMLPSSAEIAVTIYPEDFQMSLFSKKDGTGGLSIYYIDKTREITIDRSNMNIRFNNENGESRTRILDNGLTHLRIFIDHSSIEIFVNDGDAVFTSRIFPEETERYFTLSDCTSINIWELNPTVKDDFVI